MSDHADPLARIAPETLRMARDGRSWPMLEIKQALADLSVMDAAGHYASALGLDRQVLEHKPVCSLLEHARAHAPLFRESARAGERFTNRPPRVIGAGDHRLLEHTTRTAYVARLGRVRVRGRSQLVETDDAVLLDFEGEELARIEDQLELDAAVFRRDGESAWILAPGQSVAHIEEAFSLLGPNSFAFGHWLVEYLPRLWTALASGLPSAGLRVLVDAGMAPQQRQALARLVPDDAIVEVAPGAAVDIARLWVAPTYYYAPVYPRFDARFRSDFVAAPPERFAAIFDGLAPALCAGIAPRTDAPRVYLARKPGSHRMLVNHEDVEMAAASAGCTLVFPQDIGFAEQVALARGAELLVGPEGSALFLAFLARPGTRVRILNHVHTEYLTTVTALMEARGLDVEVLTGPVQRAGDAGYTHFADYSIDPGAFTEWLDADR